VQELAERAYHRPVVRILNRIDLRDARPAPPEPHRHRHLVFIGRLNPQKNPTFLLDVLGGLMSLDWKLTLIGDGPLMDKVRERIVRYKLADRVTATGWLDAASVQRVLAAADILCLPSTSEGLPVAAIEALKHGLAIIASDIPGVRDVVADGVNGFLFPPGDFDAFAHKINWLLENNSTLQAMKHASWDKARLFDISAIADQYEEVLRAASQHTRVPG